MKHQTRLRFFVTTALAAALLLVPTAALAYAPTGDDFVTCVAGGDDNVECVAGIFDPNTEVEVVVEFNGAIVLSETLTADADGEVSFDFDVPTDEDGEATVTLTGTKNGEPFVLSETVAWSEDGEVIANAGMDSGTIVGIAAGAIALGAGVLVLSRRKTSAEA